MKLCPFFTNIVSEASEEDTGGATEGEESSSESEVSSERLPCIGEACQIWDIESDNCSVATSGRITHHIHQAHLHIAPHETSDITNPEGPDSAPPPTLPYASLLLQEYTCFEDMDGNHKIYGKDFQLNNDESLPPAFRGIQKSPDWNHDLPSVAWDDLYAWKREGGPDPLSSTTEE